MQLLDVKTTVAEDVPPDGTLCAVQRERGEESETLRGGAA